MKTIPQLITRFGIMSMLLLTACIETEIVPETLEPVLTLSPKSTSLTAGQTTQLQASYTDEQNMDRSELLQWRSNSPAVAEVQTGGIVTAKAPGQTWVVAFVPGKAADSTLVTVVADPNSVALVEINVPQNTILVGATLQCSATVRNNSNGIIQGKTITWQSSNTNVLTINNNGLATAVSAGTAQITASADGISSIPVIITVSTPGNASRSGNFQGNSGYNVSGKATLEPGKLSFDSSFRSANGPGLRVYLAKTAPAVLTSSNSVKLGNLKSTSGAQDYDVPSSVELGDFDFAVIYCEPFNVPFGFAKLD